MGMEAEFGDLLTEGWIWGPRPMGSVCLDRGSCCSGRVLMPYQGVVLYVVICGPAIRTEDSSACRRFTKDLKLAFSRDERWGWIMYKNERDLF